MADRRVLAIALAGGAGRRLMPLTEDRAKPAVPFGGLYRLVGFALSHLGNARCLRVCVLTPEKSPRPGRAHPTTRRVGPPPGHPAPPRAPPHPPGPAAGHRPP